MLIGSIFDPSLIYAGILAMGGWIYSIQVRGRPRWLEAAMQIPQPRGIDTVLESFNRLINLVERDYERRAGWLGALSGLVGVSSSYFLFGNLASYGVLALILTDGLSSIVGLSMGRTKVPLADGTIEGTLAGFLSYFLLLLCFISDPYIAFLVALSSSIAELYGGEDNIAVPLAATLVAFLFNAPTLIGQ